MKKTGIIIGIFVLFCFTAVAQNDINKHGGGRLEAYKIAYLTKKLNLSAEEAQKFWPIYNKYVTEISQIRRRMNRPNMDEVDMEEKVLNVRKRYKTEFSQALADEQRVNQFFKADKEFNTVVRKELQERRQLNQQKQLNKQSFRE
jgi:membrane-associated HD superfamily phosphohydrolase